MPIYEYLCAKCGVVEVMRRITERPLKRCPNCKSKLERLLSQSSFVLKGSGWYATDYARKGATTSKTDGDTTTSTPDSGKSNGAATESAAAKTESSTDKSAAAKTTE